MSGGRGCRWLIPVLVVVLLAAVAVAAILRFQSHAEDDYAAQTRVKSVELALSKLADAPFEAGSSGRGPVFAHRAIRFEERSLARQVRALIVSGAAPEALRHVPEALDSLKPAVGQVFVISAPPGTAAKPRAGKTPRPRGRVSEALGRRFEATMSLLLSADRVYRARAASAKRLSAVISTASTLALVTIFAFFFRTASRARRTAECLLAENARLLRISQDDAVTDPLTGLGNRRALKQDIERLQARTSPRHELLFAVFDLDGFKQYNDTFGHGAGDALLERMAGSLKATAPRSAFAYRLGGDEFCLISHVSLEHAQALVEAAASSLSASGDGWTVGCSWGIAWIPSDASSADDALRIADERLYTQKASRASASSQTTAALVQVLAERDTALGAQTGHVAHLATAVARELGRPEHEVLSIAQAAHLHDIGKTAIPDTILSKPGPLNDEEWSFVRRHTIIGERIIAAAPSLTHAAKLVRSSHERLDGTGYPDGLTTDQIPLGARIISVCDAYAAIISERCYRAAASPDAALAELQACAGTQFDPHVVSALQATLASSLKRITRWAAPTGRSGRLLGVAADPSR